MHGNLHKMRTHLENAQAHYTLVLSEQQLALNELLGQRLTLSYQGTINCVHCGKKTSKSFNQGYCYPCFTRLAQCDMCIMKPETCHYAAGTCREPQWGEEFCFQPHYVYLANSSGLKVGITRQNQLPTRWIDQGAVMALPIFKVASRYIAGLIEVCFAQHVSDKTSWQKMLKSHAEPINLAAERDALVARCQTELNALSQRFGAEAIDYLASAESVSINYPIHTYPSKVTSFNLDKQAVVSGVLQGIKGQYLLFDTGVINIRKFSGYAVSVEY